MAPRSNKRRRTEEGDGEEPSQHRWKRSVSVDSFVDMSTIPEYQPPQDHPPQDQPDVPRFELSDDERRCAVTLKHEAVASPLFTSSIEKLVETFGGKSGANAATAVEYILHLRQEVQGLDAEKSGEVFTALMGAWQQRLTSCLGTFAVSPIHLRAAIDRLSLDAERVQLSEVLAAAITATTKEHDALQDIAKVPAGPTRWAPIFVPYTGVPDAEKTIYVCNVQPCRNINEVVDSTVTSCRAVAGGVGPDTAFEYSDYLHPKTVTVQFQELKTAGLLAGRSISARPPGPAKPQQRPAKPRTQHIFAYPKQSPYLYTAYGVCRSGKTAMNNKAIFSSIADAFPKKSFHLRKEVKASEATPLTWLLAFQEPPGHLWFWLPVLLANGSRYGCLTFNSVVKNGSCLLCRGGGSEAHAMRKCKSLTAVSATELDISETDHQYHQYLPQLPKA